jgi:hypothetical protein
MSGEILKFVSQYSLYSGCITFTLGIIGNFLNILVFTQLKQFRNNRCAFYLTVESISNFLYQFISITLTILTSIYGDDATGRSLIWCRFRYILGQTCVLTTFYMICFAAIDEYFSTNYRFNVRQMYPLKLARCLTCTVVCTWIIHSILFIFFVDIQSSLGCVISNYVFLQYSTFFFYPVLAGLLPIVIASFFSLLAFRNVRHIVRPQLSIVHRRLDRQMTGMVLLRVIVYICLVLSYNIYRIYAIHFPISQNIPIEYAIGRLIQAIFVSFVSLNFMVKLSSYLIHICDVWIYYRSVFMSLCYHHHVFVVK